MIKVIGQMDNSDGTFESANRVYDSTGISPTIPCCTGGGIQPKVLECKVIGDLGEKKSNNASQYYQQDRVYSIGDVAMCLPSQLPGGSYRYLEIKSMNECVRLGNAYNDEKFNGGNFGGNVWDSNGLAPTMKTGASASQQCVIETEQLIIGSMQEHASIRNDGICTTLTSAMGMGGGQIPMTVETENLIVAQNDRVLELGHIEKGTGKHQSNVVYSEDGNAPTICAMYGVKQPPAMHVEVKTLQKKSEEVQCLAEQSRAEQSSLTTEPWVWEVNGVKYLIRIRKLTPKECWRLMFSDQRNTHSSDEYFERAEQVCSNTQLYKQSGNSICKNVLRSIFEQMM